MKKKGNAYENTKRWLKKEKDIDTRCKLFFTCRHETIWK